MATKCKSGTCNPPIGVSGDTEGVSPEVIEGCQDMNVTDDQLKQYMDVLLDNIERGLKKDTNPEAAVKCFPTYVQDLPNGTESGKYLALDLGGTNFRVLIVELIPGQDPQMKHKKYAVPQNVMVGTSDGLFDFLAECIADFVKEQGVADANMPLGFTFSFPLEQKGLKVGVLQMWTKGFSCPEAVGQNVVDLLKSAIDKRGDLKVDVVAVVNDTTGTLVSCAYKYPDARIGLIIGTGTNACYVEKQANAELFDEPDMGSGNVLINTEWGAFGDDGGLNFLRLPYDEDVDQNSINPGVHLHEKMISGMFMGEITRLALVKLTGEGKMFGGQASDALNTRGKFETKYVSDIEWDLKGDFSNVKAICGILGLGHATEQDYINMKYVCSCVSRRAAFLVAAGLAALIKKVGENKLAIGVDGTVFRFHPQVRILMHQKIGQLVPGTKYRLVPSEDGSGKGAALVAAAAVKNAG